MKLIDILNERVQVPSEDKISLSVLKEYIFKDWQTFNQKVVPSFRHLRNSVMKESYSTRTAKNNIMAIVEFAAKKYIAEQTNRRYAWNDMFPKNERYELVGQLIEFFEKYNLTEDSQLLTEQDGAPREAKITFSELEVEIVDSQPMLVLNFNYDEATTNYVINVLGKNASLQLSETDFAQISGILHTQIEDVSSGGNMSYLKFNVIGTSIPRNDFKILSTGNAFLNRPVMLEVIGSGEQSAPEEPVQEPVPQEPVQEPQVSDTEIREAVRYSIKQLLGD